MIRLDLYLKNTGLFKQRSQAARACRDGQVLIDGKPAKAAREIRPGQIIAIDLPECFLEAEVVDIPLRSVSKKEREKYFRLLHRQSRDSSADFSADEDLRF